MSDEPLPDSEIILFQTEDGRTRIQCRFDNETLWLTQVQIRFDLLPRLLRACEARPSNNLLTVKVQSAPPPARAMPAFTIDKIVIGRAPSPSDAGRRCWQARGRGRGRTGY